MSEGQGDDREQPRYLLQGANDKSLALPPTEMTMQNERHGPKGDCAKTTTCATEVVDAGLTDEACDSREPGARLERRPRTNLMPLCRGFTSAHAAGRIQQSMG